MSNQSSIRCDQCQLLNFSDAAFCKRCKMPFQENSNSQRGQVVNINVNLSDSAQEVNINANGASVHRNIPENSFAPAQTQQNVQPIDNDSYQPQNQLGFQQWKQMEQPQQPQQVQQYQNVPHHPSYSQQMMMPSIWRHGGELVVHKAALLPDTCVKCNDHVSNGGYTSQKYRWHNPLVYIALISPLIYVILAAVLSQRASVNIPLCSEHREQKKSIGNKLFGAGAASFAGMFISMTTGYVGFAFLIFFGAIIGLSLGYEYLFKPLKVAKIENDYVYLNGACNEYLNQFTHM